MIILGFFVFFFFWFRGGRESHGFSNLLFGTQIAVYDFLAPNTRDSISAVQLNPKVSCPNLVQNQKYME